MKVLIERSNLLKALSHAQSVVERKTTIPILANVLVDAKEDGTLTLSATDLDLGFQETITAKTDCPGATTVPAHTLYDIVRKLPEGAEVELSLEVDTNQLILKSGRSRFTLGCLPVEDFTPITISGELPYTFHLPVETFRHLIDTTRSSMSTDETRYFLNGVYIHTLEKDTGKKLRFVSTDGHRLAFVDIPAPEGAEDIPGVIVGRKAVNEVRKLVDQGEGEVEFKLSETQVVCKYNDALLTSRLIEGSFPDYEKVIPKDNNKVLVIDTKSFAESVDRVSTLSPDKDRAVKLNVNQDTLTVSAANSNQGAAVEETEVNYSFDPVETGFNARYLLDVAQHIQGDLIRLKFADASTPIIMNDENDETATFVLMPMRV